MSRFPLMAPLVVNETLEVCIGGVNSENRE